MAEDGLTALALMFKARDNETLPSITTGIVIAGPPNPHIRLNDVIAPEKENLIFASGLLKDTIIPGDEVILISVIDKQLYYVMDKAVRFS